MSYFELTEAEEGVAKQSGGDSFRAYLGDLEAKQSLTSMQDLTRLLRLLQESKVKVSPATR